MTTLASSFFIGFSSFLQVTRKTIKTQMSLKFSQIQPWTAELAALDQLKKSFTYLRTIQNILMTCWLSGERSLPFGLLVWITSDFSIDLLQCTSELQTHITFLFVNENIKCVYAFS